KRPIINTRDEPHADPEHYRRLHVIVGDANLAETSTYLKLGTTALVIAMIEAGWPIGDLMPVAPVTALHTISHDPELKAVVELRDGRRLTGVQLQREFAEQAARFVGSSYGTDTDEQTADVLQRWHTVLDALEQDPGVLADQLDWPAKLRLLEGYRRRDGLDWRAARLELVDVQYSDVRPSKGLALALEARGQLRRLTTDHEVSAALDAPPHDTRAYFRGECIRRYRDSVAAASWDSVIFDVPTSEPLIRVPTLDPLRGTRAHVAALLDRCPDAASLVTALSAGPAD
ncbi:MAG: hypothetical protein RLZ55_995, partial [Actinomycetota bacterium]